MILRALLALWTSVARPMGDHLWQSTLFLAVAAILVLALRKNQARVRYWVWLTASVKFLIPLTLLTALGSHLATPRVSTPAQVLVYSAVEDFSQPFAGQQTPVIYHSTPTAAPVSLLHLLPAIVVAVWLVGIAVVLLRWVIGWVRISLMVRKAASVGEGPEVEALRCLESSLGVRTPIRLVLSPDWMEPGIFGVFRPMLIWPEGISQHLDDRHIEAILAHEVCHARRHDNLTAVLHMLVDAIFWFHPLVWWVGARLEAERERACDEEVSLLCNQPHVYAESILRVCKFCSESPLTCVSGVTGADLKRRVVQIMTEQAGRKLTPVKKLLLAATGLLVIAVPIMLGQATAARRFMLAAIKDAPQPVQFAAHAMLTESQEPAGEEIAASTQNSPNREQPSSDPATASDSSPQFDAASVKPSDASNSHRGFNGSPGGRVFFGGSARMLVQYAYGLQDYQVTGGPDWASSDTFVINAVPPDDSPSRKIAIRNGEPTAEQRRMLQSLLRDRFGLQCHFETKEGEVYVLTRGASPLQFVAPKNPDDPPGATVIFKGTDKGMIEDGEARGRNTTIDYLAIQFGRYLRVPVINQTGITGSWDFQLDPVDPDNQDIPTAVYSVVDRLGLKIKRGRGPVQTLIIDHIEKPTVDGAEVQPAASVVPVAMVQEKAQGSKAMVANADPGFEVATIKPSAPDGPGKRFGWRGGHLITSKTNLNDLIAFAYGLHAKQIVDAPAWFGTDLYDIEGKPDTEGLPSMKQLGMMVQKLLADRFKLTFHHDKRELSVYVISVASGGPKMTKSTASSDDDQGFGFKGLGNLTVSNMTMADFASWMQSGVMDRPVVDQTGLTDRYDFQLKWTPDDSQFAQFRTAGATAPSPSDDPNAPPSLYTALQEQLGLKMRPGKVPDDIIVIDHVERPSPN